MQGERMLWYKSKTSNPLILSDFELCLKLYRRIQNLRVGILRYNLLMKFANHSQSTPRLRRTKQDERYYLFIMSLESTFFCLDICGDW